MTFCPKKNKNMDGMSAFENCVLDRCEYAKGLPPIAKDTCMLLKCTHPEREKLRKEYEANTKKEDTIQQRNQRKDLLLRLEKEHNKIQQMRQCMLGKMKGE